MQLNDDTKQYLIRDALSVWCPTFPRRVTAYQATATTEVEALGILRSNPNDGFVSVNTFTNGHTSEGNVPGINTLFIDFDIPKDGYYGAPDNAGEASVVSWSMDLQRLLDATSDVVRVLEAYDIVRHWRFSLSGHKGIHLFVDFNELPYDMGEVHQYRAGIDRYLTELIALIESEIDYSLAEWIDVDSSDMARLTRLPNTLHPKATNFFGESRYCVAVTPDELKDMTPGEYVRLTQSPRLIPEACRRDPSTNARRKLIEYIAGASPRERGQFTSVNPTTVTQYDREANELSLPDVRSFMLTRVGEMWSWRNREDAFLHGAESHFFEFAVIQEMVSRNVPRETMLEFFRPMHGFDEQFTRDRIATIISQGYQNPVGYSKLKSNCPTFL